MTSTRCLRETTSHINFMKKYLSMLLLGEDIDAIVLEVLFLKILVVQYLRLLCVQFKWRDSRSNRSRRFQRDSKQYRSDFDPEVGTTDRLPQPVDWNLSTSDLHRIPMLLCDCSLAIDKSRQTLLFASTAEHTLVWCLRQHDNFKSDSN